MPIHDWTRVEQGIFHDFHHAWIAETSRFLNSALPSIFYALLEQFAAGFGPDVLTFQARGKSKVTQRTTNDAFDGGETLLLAPLNARLPGEAEFYRRKQKTVTVRHVSNDRIIAIVEIVSPGNKSSRSAVRALLDKATELLNHGVHLLMIDLFPPTARDPGGLHPLIWASVTNQRVEVPSDKPLTLAAYEAGNVLRYFVEPVAVGDSLIDMPLFLEPGAHVDVPLNAVYESAFAAVPRRWRSELE